MRSAATLLALFALLCTALPAQSQKPANILEGSWEMVSQTLVYPDSVLDRGQGLGPSFKLLNSTHFAFGRQSVHDGELHEEVYGGGGRYDLIGDSLYIEHIEYHSALSNVGLSVEFRARIEGDTWYHEGKIGDMLLREVWRRIK